MHAGGLTWQALPAGALGARADRAGADPLLVWADATGLADFQRPGQAARQRWPVLVQLQPGCTVAQLRALPGASVSTLYPATARHCSAELTTACLQDWLQGGRAARFIARLELQLPVLPQRALPGPAAALPGPRRANRPLARGPLLLGVVDSGCPFAHQRLRRDPRQPGTRVLALWDQGAGASRLPGGAALPGWQRPAPDPGRELLRTQLDALTRRARTPQGMVDEDRCYRLAGLPGLAHRIGHGAGLLDLLAGPVPYGQRSFAPDRPPSFGLGAAAPAPDAAAQADLVFVQLPRDVVQDASSAALPRHLLDGLRYVLLHAGPETQAVVVNVSDGSSRGSHDGRSLIEHAMAELVDEADQAGRHTLHIVLPAGNSFEEQRHAVLDGWQRQATHRLQLALPPDSEAPAWVMLQVPPALQRQLRVRLLPPGRGPAADAPGTRLGEAHGWQAPGAPGGAAVAGVVFAAPAAGPAALAPVLAPVLVAFAPTRVAGPHRAAAPAGLWTLELAVPAPLPADAPVHAYLCRNQTNLGAQARGRQARFVDAAYDPQRHLRPLADDPQPPASAIRRRGTLNSLATGARTLAVGGVRGRDWQPTRYASAADAPSALPAGARAVLDGSALCDENAALDGLHVAGNRSGASVRLRGTSFAAPQAARVLAHAVVGSLPRARPLVPGQPGRSGALLWLPGGPAAPGGDEPG